MSAVCSFNVPTPFQAAAEHGPSRGIQPCRAAPVLDSVPEVLLRFDRASRVARAQNIEFRESDSTRDNTVATLNRIATHIIGALAAELARAAEAQTELDNAMLRVLVGIIAPPVATWVAGGVCVTTSCYAHVMRKEGEMFSSVARCA